MSIVSMMDEYMNKLNAKAVYSVDALLNLLALGIKSCVRIQDWNELESFVVRLKSRKRH